MILENLEFEKYHGLGNDYDFYAANSSGKSYFAGDVGIGVNNSNYKLDVNGSINVNSNNITSVDCITFSSGGKICSGS